MSAWVRCRDTSSVDRVEFSREPRCTAESGRHKLGRVSILQTIQIDDQFRRAMVIRTIRTNAVGQLGAGQEKHLRS